MPAAERRLALRDGLDAYDRGDYFLAHELLEPAWMGTRNVAERELIQGLIKLAAAYVHAARGNPAGVAKNLRGAAARVRAGASAAGRIGVDADAVLAAIELRLDGFEGQPLGSVGLAEPAVAVTRRSRTRVGK